jgi:hypothetical protein
MAQPGRSGKEKNELRDPALRGEAVKHLGYLAAMLVDGQEDEVAGARPLERRAHRIEFPPVLREGSISGPESSKLAL